MEEIQTERLRILPLSLAELQALVNQYKCDAPELSQAYGEMLYHCQEYPDQFLWYTSWKFCKKESATVVGYAGFKGLSNGKHVEIGYGVDAQYEGNGYATEGVKGLCQWAFSTDQVTFIEAETEPDNAASQKVLQKNGFIATGKNGEEGPRFLLGKR